MQKFGIGIVATCVMLAVVAGTASAQRLSAGGKCEAAKNQEAGKYAACLHKAEARLIKTRGACSLTSETLCFRDDDCPLAETCIKDTAKVDAAVAKCGTKFAAKWDKLEAAAATKGDVCPDGLLAPEIKDAVDDHVANMAGALAGEGLAGPTLPARRLKTGQTQCWSGSTVVPCAGTGQDGELQMGLTVSHTTNANGTITDNRTGLVWERLHRGGGINDWGATFTWVNAFNKIKVLNGDATGCIAAGNPSSCCTGAGTGSGCTAFAGFTDWRLPNVNELQSLANYGTFNPAVHAAFNSSCTASCSTCSCTQSSDYWSATALQPVPGDAWGAEFETGYVFTAVKTWSTYVRAVRGGS